MGVPKFYRWISERYPCLSEVITDTQIPEFDNLYLDMNGIIHTCSHPNDDDATFRISEEQIFADIFGYIERLFRMIRPQKVFYMAIDGVAPRAKMNQQRARRFMSAKNAAKVLEEAKKRGEEIPDDKRFDSNVITPGTPFMTELHQRLIEFVKRKINTDPSWSPVSVYLSGHDCPGEGEHKVMDFIRAERAKPDYDPNTRHCMYGLDADLIMLGICSHEPHFSLLREEVKFTMPSKAGRGKKQDTARKTDATAVTFHLLHLSLLREYLGHEFAGIEDKLSFPYEMERVIDDWVLMGFLVGNDFLPHLPNVHIHDDALPLLYDTYKRVLPSLDGYMNESGTLVLPRFQKFLAELARNDRHCFLQKMEDEEYLASKREQSGAGAPGAEEELVRFSDPDMSESDEEEEGKEGGKSTTDTSDADAAFVSSDSEDEGEKEEKGEKWRRGSSEEEDGEDLDGGMMSAADALAENFDPAMDEFSESLALMQFKEMSDKEFENNVDNCWSRSVGNAFKRHKREYYKEKLRYGNISRAQLKEQAEGYVRGIQWNLHYYYNGCVSWNWYYPHHYAPYISDVVDFHGMTLDFELGRPFRPFEQLLAVLPAASAEALPLPMRELMCNADSPIADFYPTDFETDLNGKKAEWEAVVLIPFIDEKRLLEAIAEKEPRLSADERARNSHGPHVLVTRDETKQEGQWARVDFVDMNEFRLKKEQVVHGLLPNVKLDVFFPGFPTMKHLPYTAEMKEVGVKVFHMNSRKPSMQLTIGERTEFRKELYDVAADILGEEACVDWPILKQARVHEMWNKEFKWQRRGDGGVECVPLDDDERDVFNKTFIDAKDRQLSRYAISASSRVLVWVRRLLGVTYEVVDGVLKPCKQWAGEEQAVPVLLDLLVRGVSIEQGRRMDELTVEQAYPINCKVFVMEHTWDGFGHPALVQDIKTDDKGTRATVQVAISSQPELRAFRQQLSSYALPWMGAHEASRRCGVGRKLISRITGSMFLCEKERTNAVPSYLESINVGLALKLTKRNLEVADYTRRMPDGYWEYSMLCVQLITEYNNKFRELFNYFDRANSGEDVYYACEIWPNPKKMKERLSELKEWLSGLPTVSGEKLPGGSVYADSSAIAAYEKILANTPRTMQAKRSSVNPAKLYRAELHDGKVRPDAEADFQLFDRVTNCVQGTSVPFGLQGVVVGIAGDKIDVIFDREFPGGFKIRSEIASGFTVPVASLVNMTYGRERKGRKAQSGGGGREGGARREQTRMGAGRDRDQQMQQAAYSTMADRPRNGGKNDSKSPRVQYGAPPAVLQLMQKQQEKKQGGGEGGKKEQKKETPKKPAKGNGHAGPPHKGDDDQKRDLTAHLNSLLGLGRAAEASKEHEKVTPKKKEQTPKKKEKEQGRKEKSPRMEKSEKQQPDQLQMLFDSIKAPPPPTRKSPLQEKQQRVEPPTEVLVQTQVATMQISPQPSPRQQILPGMPMGVLQPTMLPPPAMVQQQIAMMMAAGLPPPGVLPIHPAMLAAAAGAGGRGQPPPMFHPNTGRPMLQPHMWRGRGQRGGRGGGGAPPGRGHFFGSSRSSGPVPDQERQYGAEKVTVTDLRPSTVTRTRKSHHPAGRGGRKVVVSQTKGGEEQKTEQTEQAGGAVASQAAATSAHPRKQRIAAKFLAPRE